VAEPLFGTSGTDRPTVGIAKRHSDLGSGAGLRPQHVVEVRVLLVEKHGGVDENVDLRLGPVEQLPP
jgi:hypothetical protein